MTDLNHAAICKVIKRPRHISPPPDDDHWLSVPGLDAAFAWRVTQTLCEELEKRPVFYHERPYNTEWEPWATFKQQILETDQLWIFHAPKRFWRIGMGMSGVVLVRENVPISILVRSMN